MDLPTESIDGKVAKRWIVAVKSFFLLQDPQNMTLEKFNPLPNLKF